MSDLVGNPEDRFACVVAAHMYYCHDIFIMRRLAFKKMKMQVTI